MSDYIHKIIPVDVTAACTDKVLMEARFLVEEALGAVVEAIDHGATSFIDCGDGLKSISCPICGTEVSFAWWGEQMDCAASSEFTELNVTLPCCRNQSSLNDLVYEQPCGFAGFELDVVNPERKPDPSLLGKLEEKLDTALKVIVCHY